MQYGYFPELLAAYISAASITINKIQQKIKKREDVEPQGQVLVKRTSSEAIQTNE